MDLVLPGGGLLPRQGGAGSRPTVGRDDPTARPFALDSPCRSPIRRATARPTSGATLTLPTGSAPARDARTSWRRTRPGPMRTGARPARQARPSPGGSPNRARRGRSRGRSRGSTPRPARSGRSGPNPSPSSGRSGHPGVRPGDRTNPNDVDAYFKRGLALRPEEPVHAGDQGLRPGGPAQPEGRRGVQQPLLGARHGRRPPGGAAGLQRIAAAEAQFRRCARQPRPGQPEDRPAGAGSPTTTRRLRVNPKHASALFGRGKAKLKSGDSSGGNADIRPPSRSIARSPRSSRATGSDSGAACNFVMNRRGALGH